MSSGKSQKYNPKALFLAGLMAFGNIFKGVKVAEKSALSKKQMKVRKAFKAQGVARRLQRAAA